MTSWEEIYKRSKIDWDEYYQQCIILTSETSNTFESIEKMEYHKFNSLIFYLNKYIEEKNKRESGGNGDVENPADIHKNAIRDQKSMMNSMKMPSFKK